MAKPLPDARTPLLGDDGKSMNPIWFDYFFAHQRLTQLPDVSTVAPTNGQVMIYNSTTKLWTPGTN